MALKTRRPTGRPAWPLVLIEGGEKSGKSWLAAELAASPRIGRTIWLDLGEGSADEYLDPTDSRHEIVIHDGTYTSLLAAVTDAKDEAAKALANGDRPTLLVVDSMTLLWELLSAIADQKARLRAARRLKRDISADESVTIGTDLWNEANSKHRKIMTVLMTFPGVAVITARGKDVVRLAADGTPIQGQKDYKVEGQKNLGFDSSIWIRLSREAPPTLMGVRHKRYGIRPGVDKPRVMPDLTLDHLLFDVLGYDAANAQERDLVQPAVTDADLAEPTSGYATVLEAAIDGASTEDELRTVHGQIKPALDAGRISREDADWLYARVQARKPHVIPSPASQRRQPDRAAANVTAGRGPVEDRPAAVGQPEPATAPETSADAAPKQPGPEPITDRQLKWMHAIWSELGRTTRDQYLADASTVLGRQVESTKTLAREEADRVIAWLEAERETQRRARAMSRAEATVKGDRPPADPEPAPAPAEQPASRSQGTATADLRQQVLDALVRAGYKKPSEQREKINSLIAPGQVRSFRDLTPAMCQHVLNALAERQGAAA